MTAQDLTATACSDVEVPAALKLVRALTDELKDAEAWAIEQTEHWDRTEEEWARTRKELQARTEKAEAESASMEARKAAHVEKTATIKRSLDEAVARVKMVESEKVEVERAITLLEKDLAATEAREAESQRASKEVQEELASTLDAIAAQGRRDAEHKKELALAEKWVQDVIVEFKTKLSGMGEELVAMSVEKAHIEDQLEKLRRPVVDPMSHLRERAAEARSGLLPLEEKLMENREKHASACARSASAAARLAQLRAEEAAFREEHEAGDCARREEEEEQHQECQRRLESTRRELKSMRASCKSTGMTIVTADHVSAVQAEVAELRANNQLVEEEIKQALIVLGGLKHQTRRERKDKENDGNAEKRSTVRKQVTKGSEPAAFAAQAVPVQVEESHEVSSPMVNATEHSGKHAGERAQVESQGVCHVDIQDEVEERQQVEEPGHEEVVDDVYAEGVEVADHMEHMLDMCEARTPPKVVEQKKKGTAPPQPKRAAREKKSMPSAKNKGDTSARSTGAVTTWWGSIDVADRAFGIFGVIIIVQACALASHSVW
uniref:Uncharacterized protein n=1 Tax=Noctiluca scintillans TaxID=2966 RepID=A0A7S1AZN2_NOCSC